jgi:hypothetical protein
VNNDWHNLINPVSVKPTATTIINSIAIDFKNKPILLPTVSFFSGASNFISMFELD